MEEKNFTLIEGLTEIKNRQVVSVKRVFDNDLHEYVAFLIIEEFKEENINFLYAIVRNKKYDYEFFIELVNSSWLKKYKIDRIWVGYMSEEQEIFIRGYNF